MSREMESITELVCELTRNCNLKEEYFAASFNLSPTEVRILKLFSSAQSFTIKELREKLKLTPGRITHILTSLEEKKLLLRVQDSKDKRTILVNLQPKAQPLINNLEKSYDALHRSILQNVDSAELAKIKTSVQILNDVFKKWVNEK